MTTAKSPTLSDAEEAEIKAGIARDPENPEWTDAEFASSRPFAEVFPKLAEAIRERGLRKPPTKKTVSLRLDQDVLDAFKASGTGWQSRINETLRKAAGL